MNVIGRVAFERAYYDAVVQHVNNTQHGLPIYSLVGRVCVNGQVIAKSQNIAQDTSLLNIQHYKVRIKCKVELSRKRSSALPYTSV